MSVWNIGANDVTEEAQAFKDHLASKEGHIAAQETKIMQQSSKLEELNTALNEALQRLNSESLRVVQLEDDLSRATDDLRNERVASQNLRMAMSTAQDKLKATESDARDLHATIDTLSRKFDGASVREAKLEQEKSVLNMRVGELEATVRQLNNAAQIPTPSRTTTPRSRSSSVSNSKALERELQETRLSLHQKESELSDLAQKLTQVNEMFIRNDNDRIANERRLTSQVAALQETLMDKDEELEFMRKEHTDGSREEQLMQRIDEDGAKIEELEKLAAEASRVRVLEEKLLQADRRMQELVKEHEGRHIDLVIEKEEALDMLEAARVEIQRISADVREKEDMIAELKANSVTNQGGAVDEATAAHIERLLGAITRLRGERDDLRRDLEFQESESKFTIEALEAKLALGRSGGNSELLSPQSCQIRSLRLATSALATVIQHSDAHAEKLGISFAQTQIQLRTKEDALSQMELSLRASAQHLETVIAERDALYTQLRCKTDAWTNQHDQLLQTQRETNCSLVETQTKLAEVVKSFEDLESERDSLQLQIANLTSDLTNAQAELANAESRYSELQLHRLSAMSSSDAVHSLREQIEELEMRVLRRTEQIGLHQHDIKRLETNLRLQEERLVEMTMENDTLAAQKEAMVEDCAAAREARDEAVKQLESLELEIERLESKTEQTDDAIVTLIAVIADTINRSRIAIRICEERSTRSQGEAELKLLQTGDELHRLAALYQSTTQQLGDKVAALGHLKSDSSENLRNVCIALAISRAEIARVVGVMQALKDTGSQLQEQSRSRLVEIERLSAEIERLHDCQEVEAAEHGSRTIALEATVDRLGAEALAVQAAHRDVIQQLELRVADLQSRLAEVDGPENTTIRAQLQSLQTQSDAAKADLEDAIKSLEAARQARDETEAKAKDAQEESIRQQEALQAQMEAGAHRIAELEGLQSSLAKERDDRVAELALLQQRLDDAVSQLELQRQTMDKVRTQASQELKDAQTEFEQRMSESRESLLAIQEVHRVELEERTRQLDEYKSKVDHLEAQLRKEADDLVQLQTTHQMELAQANERFDEAASTRARDLDMLREDLSHFKDVLDGVQKERDALQIEITTLEAEIQRSLSLRRFLESQIQDHDRNISSLSETLDQLRTSLSETEKRAQTAEMNLSLQSAHHKREISDLQRELATLQSRPNMDAVVAELEERKNEMEEMLRAKCAEIEENDDRVLDLLKDNKKLTSRVESLTRKVQNLQTKLTTAKANGGPAPYEGTPVLRPPQGSVAVNSADLEPSTSRSKPNIFTSMPSVAASTMPSSSSTSLARHSSNRTVSGPSTFSRSKTPESKAPPPPVFTMRTPEQPATVPEPELIASGIGKKRRVPEEWETENIPMQTYNIDSLPENRTPRARRVLESIHSSFTPVRNSASRPAAAFASPKRLMGMGARSPTKSPRRPSQPLAEIKSSKRSWLGKIRGVSSQGGIRAASSRPNYGQDDIS